MERFATSRTSSALATKPDHPLIKYIPGMEQDFLWVQFSLYCGISKKPVLVTPKITTKDFVKKDERNYYYFVD
ncbi:MAG TPA: hypothetical protein DCO77_12665 [Nitrospiraceae bacterium]|nr:hypothetical protein [Nitrospiraceae bacterium]